VDSRGTLRREARTVRARVRRSFFDTNVLVYLFDDRDPEEKSTAQKVFAEESGVGRTVLSTQVLQEFYWAVTRKLATPLCAEVAEERVRDFSGLPLVRVDESMILAAIARGRSQSLSFWDALIVEAALSAGADRLITEDLQHEQRIEDLTVVNPFVVTGQE
jgi:predicted nucleic acid-binding protein